MSTPEHGKSPADHTPGSLADVPPATPVAPPKAAAPATAPNPAPTAETFPVPTGPHTTSVGGHLLGILVGLVLTLLAMFLITLGQSRILADGVGRSDLTPETFGIVLVALGALVAGAVALLGMWTPTAPLTGGLVALLVGAAYLFAPAAAHEQTVRLLATEQNRTAVLNSITVGTTGGLFILGIVLLGAATALSLVRRRGLELGAFRERSHASPAK